MLSILIVDDHLVVRHGLKHIVNEEFRNAVFGEAATAGGALSAIAKRPWDLILLDVTLPDQDGLQLLPHIRLQRPDSKVLVFTVHCEYQYAARAIRDGASGCISKDATRVELVKALKTVVGGAQYLPVAPARAPVPDASPDPTPRHSVLSAREYKVMLAIAAGKPHNEIAADLALSVKTVSTYKRRVFNKMQLHSTADLVRYVINHKLS